MNHENLKIFSSSRIIYYPLEEKVNRSREELELRGKPFITQGKYEKLEGSRINIQAGQQRARLTYSSSVLIDKNCSLFHFAIVEYEFGEIMAASSSNSR